jgi:uncharacterized protein
MIAIQEDTTVKTLRISKDLELPLDAVTQTLAFIARKGGGKTYGAQLLAEEMLGAGAQVVAIDPVGNWYSLRLAADGKGRGREIYVFGGEHGDVPLTPEAGARIAQLVVEKRISVVLDVSTFRKAERKRFAAQFAEELFHRKKAQRSPMHLFLEEAQKLVPQVPEADERQMLGAFEDIVRLGRNYGIGCTMITQRPQSVNKEVLSQTECLVVLQVNGEHERKALEAWVKEANADRQLVGELPGLAVGEAYVWSPSWLRTFKRIRLGKKATFDASATPQVGRAAAAAGKLSPMDVEALRADLVEVVKKAEADDPKALRRQIVELQRELARKPAAAPPPPAKVERIEIPVLKDGQVKRLEGLVVRLDKLNEAIQSAKQDVVAGLLRIAGARAAPPAPPLRREGAALGATPARPPQRAAPSARPQRSTAAGHGESLPKGERAVLTAAAQHDGGVTREQLTVLTGYKRSSRDTYLQRLRERELVVMDGERIVATAAGIAALGPNFEPLPTGEALLEHWRAQLPAGERAVLEVVVAAWPEAVDRERISEATEYQRSSRDTYLQRLRSRQLVTDAGRGQVRASPNLMEARG